MSYLYFVLPPIIIVISLAFVIFLISKKSFEIEREMKLGKKIEDESRLSMEFKSKWLHFLEKIAHWFKVFSLRMHNWLEERLTFIKTKKIKIESDLDKKDFRENGIDEWVRGEKEKKTMVQSEKKEVFNSMDVVQGKKINRIRNIFNRNEARNVQDDFVEFREEQVMLSKEVAYPEEKKDELENILVERIAADPRDIEAYERLGDYYVSQGNNSDAKACYKQVLKLNPQSLSVRNKLNRFNR